MFLRFLLSVLIFLFLVEYTLRCLWDEHSNTASILSNLSFVHTSHIFVSYPLTWQRLCTMFPKMSVWGTETLGNFLLKSPPLSVHARTRARTHTHTHTDLHFIQILVHNFPAMWSTNFSNIFSPFIMNPEVILEGTYGSKTITTVLLQAIIHSSMRLFTV
jgi:hypothetical protein